MDLFIHENEEAECRNPRRDVSIDAENPTRRPRPTKIVDRVVARQGDRLFSAAAIYTPVPGQRADN